MVHRHSSASFSSHGSCGPWPAVGLQAEWRLAFADDSSAGVTEHSLAVDFESHASPPGEAWPEGQPTLLQARGISAWWLAPAAIDRVACRPRRERDR